MNKKANEDLAQQTVRIGGMAAEDGVLGRSRCHWSGRRIVREGERLRNGAVLQSASLGDLVAICVGSSRSRPGRDKIRAAPVRGWRVRVPA